MLLSFLHGTDLASAEAIIRDGVTAEPPSRVHDPGDFGWGFYLTRDPARARSYGHTLVGVDVHIDRFAVIPNPYFIDRLTEIQPVTAVEKLFHSIAFRNGRMRTCTASIEERIAIARSIRNAFVLDGFAGIRTERPDGETVLFDAAVVRKTWLV